MTPDNTEPDINKILANAAIIGLENIGKRTFDTIKKAWLRIDITSRYGFTITQDEANTLNDIAKNPTYIAFKSAIGTKSPFTRFIKVGLLLYELNSRGEKDRVKEIRSEIYNSQYSNRYVQKIIHIASTGVLLHILDYLTYFKDTNKLSDYAIREEFKRILRIWQEIGVPVKKEDNETTIKNNIQSLITKKVPIIIVYASESAVPRAHLAIADLSNKKVFVGKYILWSKNLTLSGFNQFLGLLYASDTGLDSPFG
ncbi:MAG TPA: hypothetical protein HA362_03125 [Nanoarchaeota archaeon]|nr:hypothetical protein [Nanoarchaeota archaeon]